MQKDAKGRKEVLALCSGSSLTHGRKLIEVVCHDDGGMMPAAPMFKACIRLARPSCGDKKTPHTSIARCSNHKFSRLAARLCHARLC